jgi:hypothetical protein
MSPRSVLPELMTTSRSLLWIEPVLKKLESTNKIESFARVSERRMAEVWAEMQVS